MFNQIYEYIYGVWNESYMIYFEIFQRKALNIHVSVCIDESQLIIMTWNQKLKLRNSTIVYLMLLNRKEARQHHSNTVIFQYDIFAPLKQRQRGKNSRTKQFYSNIL